jgi:hypothetical protein
MYDPEIEDSWLKFGTQLLLLLTYRSPDFDLALFQPLTDSKFYEYSIDCSVQRRSLPMSPLFSSQSQDAFQSQSASMDIEAALPTGSMLLAGSFGGASFVANPPLGTGEVRATATPRFTPTIDAVDATASTTTTSGSSSNDNNNSNNNSSSEDMGLVLGSQAPSFDVFAKPSITDYRTRRLGTLRYC